MHYLTKAALRTLYLSWIHSQLMYDTTTWEPAIHNTNSNTTFKLQKKAIKMISKISQRAHADPLYKITEILKMQDVCEPQSVLFMSKYETITFSLNKNPDEKCITYTVW